MTLSIVLSTNDVRQIIRKDLKRIIFDRFQDKGPIVRPDALGIYPEAMPLTTFKRNLGPSEIIVQGECHPLRMISVSGHIFFWVSNFPSFHFCLLLKCLAEGFFLLLGGKRKWVLKSKRTTLSSSFSVNAPYFFLRQKILPYHWL